MWEHTQKVLFLDYNKNKKGKNVKIRAHGLYTILVCPLLSKQMALN